MALLTQDTRDKIARAQKAYNQELEAIRANGDLSEQGRRRLQAKVYAETKRKVDAMRTEEEQRLGRLQKDLERSLFSVADQRDTVSAAVSYRDAQERAAQLRTAEEAQSLMRRALNSGDELLARAVMARAWTHPSDSWSPVVAAYFDEHPEKLPAAQQLGEMLDAQGGRAGAITDEIHLSITPPAGMRSHDAAELAAGE